MRISFIGAGKLARKRSEQLAGRNDVTILGYVGKGEARAKELAAVYKAKAYGCLADLLDDSPDGVVICTPCDTHSKLIDAALESGIHAFAEYPFAFKDAELSSLFSKATEKHLMVGIGCDHLETMTQLREFVAKLGTVFSAYHDGFFGTSSKEKWYWDFQQSGGTWMLWGIDQIASLCHLLGRVRSVHSKRTCAFGHDDLSEAVNAMLEFHSGAVGVIQTTIHAPGYFMSLRIVGSEGSIDCRHSAGGAPFVVKARGGKETSEIPVVGNGKRLDIDSWLDSIDSGKNCLMTPEDIAHWHLVAYACQESQKTGQTVRL